MKANILGVYIDRLSMQDTLSRIQQAIEKHNQIRVITANPELIYKASTDLRLRRLINTADIVTPDGVGVVWAAKKTGLAVPERVTGIDLVQELFPLAQTYNWRLFFLGGKPGVAKEAARRVGEQYPGLTIESEHGYFDISGDVKIVRKIREFNPDLLLVGLGAPRQEYWIADHPDLATVGIGVGGSFDVLAGVALRAPDAVQKLKLEWLYRLWKEPWRWRRQMVLPKFALKVFFQGKGKR
ncbi:MAG: WecB/TagA/CpsF family glycosyltransferase [Desulfitobacterium hafniense]|nr:WecB/TagA/CpsF family glycosyltransferase [Desulfitobacterium hafniense]